MIGFRFGVWISVLALLCLPSVGWAQIVDDSTKQTYGPATVVQLTQEELLAGTRKGAPLDTTLRQFHNSSELNGDAAAFYKTLGFIASPQAPFFPDFNYAIGRQLGQGYTQHLYYDPLTTPYYRSYSLYSRIHYNQGSYGRQWITAELARNLAPNFNISFRLRRLTTQRQVYVITTRQKQSEQTSYSFNINGSTLKNKLRYIATFSNFKQILYDYGGALPRPAVLDTNFNIIRAADTYDSLFKFEQQPARLPNVTTVTENRRGIVVGGSYELSSNLSINATASAYSYIYKYLSASAPDAGLNFIPDPAFLYAKRYLNGDTSKTRIQYLETYAQAGFRATVSGFALTGTAKLRRVRYATDYFEHVDKVEPTLMGTLGYKLDSLRTATFAANYIVGRDYKLLANVNLFGLALGAGFAHTAPTLMSQNMVSNNYVWNNDFNFVNTATLSAKFLVGLPHLTLGPFAKYNLITNYIYYGPNVSPSQKTSPLSVLYAGTNLDIDIGKFHWDNTGWYAKASDNKVIRVPEALVQSNLYFRIRLANGRYQLEPGIETRFRTGFYADQYESSVNLFHLQRGGLTDETQAAKGSLFCQPYTLNSLYINVRINRTRGFVKLGNITQGLGSPGYMDVAYYPGQRRFFEFGVDWMFFE